MIKVSRAINGITINGSEYLLNEDREIMLFENTKTAKKYLKSKGINNFKGLNFEE